MVHGTNYGIQYEIVLNEDIDFYDDLLPIWTSTRCKIEKTKNGGEIKLIIFTIYDFSEQLENTIFNDFLKYSYHSDCDINFSSMPFLLSHYYNKGINKDKISDVEYDNYLLQYFELKKNIHYNTGHDAKYIKIFNILVSHTIIKNMNEIKKLEQSYYDLITLTPQQNEIIEKVLTHPKLKDKIKSNGLKISHINF